MAGAATASAAPGPSASSASSKATSAELNRPCTTPAQRAVRGGEISFVVRCKGAKRIGIVRQRGPGRVRLVQLQPGTARITFRAPTTRAITVLRLRTFGRDRDAFPGQVIRTTNPMIRAMGGSVTSGFAYYGPLGRPMLITQAEDCFTLTNPPDNRCSSNSGNGPHCDEIVPESVGIGAINNLRFAGPERRTSGGTPTGSRSQTRSASRARSKENAS